MMEPENHPEIGPNEFAIAQKEVLDAIQRCGLTKYLTSDREALFQFAVGMVNLGARRAARAQFGVQIKESQMTHRYVPPDRDN